MDVFDFKKPFLDSSNFAIATGRSMMVTADETARMARHAATSQELDRLFVKSIRKERLRLNEKRSLANDGVLEA